MFQFFDKNSSPKEQTLFILSGPSGVGKSTVLNHLLSKFDNLKKLVSYTTREPRANEIPGLSYNYISQDEYAAMEARGDFLQSVGYVENSYGYTKQQILENMRQGFNVIADVDFRALPILKEHFNCITIFIAPPSVEAVQSRLKSRGDEAEDITKRMKNYEETMQSAKDYDIVVVNEEGKLSDTLAIIHNIIETNSLPTLTPVR